MALAGNALIAIWNDIAPEMREDFFEWHPREHMVERLGVPGFIRGRRCVAIEADVEFLTLYEVAGPEVLVSDVYKRRLTHPTPWSTKVLPAFRKNVRGACRIHFSAGYAMGGFVQTIRLKAEEHDSELIGHIAKELLPKLTEAPRITGAHLVENDAGLTGGNAGQQRGRMISLPHIVIVVEGSSADGVRDACDRHLSSERLRALGAEGGVERGLYQLEYSIQNLVA